MINQILSNPTPRQRAVAWSNRRFNPFAGSIVQADCFKNRIGSIIEWHFGDQSSRHGWTVCEIDGWLCPINFLNIPSVRDHEET